jgi:hypothetical protein
MEIKKRIAMGCNSASRALLREEIALNDREAIMVMTDAIAHVLLEKSAKNGKK